MGRKLAGMVNGGSKGRSGKRSAEIKFNTQRSPLPALKRGDVFWATLPEEVGSVQKGTRPVLVVQNNIGNRVGSTVIAASITSKLSKQDYPVNVKIPGGILPKPSEVRLSQLRTVDKSTLGQRIAHLPGEVMARVDDALRVSLGLPKNKG